MANSKDFDNLLQEARESYFRERKVNMDILNRIEALVYKKRAEQKRLPGLIARLRKRLS